MFFNDAKEINLDELAMINGGYILDRGADCGDSCRYALIDDKTGEWYCMANTAQGASEHVKARKNSTQIISLDEYRDIFGKDF